MKITKTAGRLAGVTVAGGVLALGMLAGGATAASAATGSCYAVEADGGKVVYSCKGTVTIIWTCWSDLLGRDNHKTLKLGTWGLSSSFTACNVGNVKWLGWK